MEPLPRSPSLLCISSPHRAYKDVDTCYAPVYTFLMSVDSNHDVMWLRVLQEQGRSQTWLARRTGIARNTLYCYGMGRRRTPDAWLVKAAEALGVPVELLRDEKAA